MLEPKVQRPVNQKRLRKPFDQGCRSVKHVAELKNHVDKRGDGNWTKIIYAGDSTGSFVFRQADRNYLELFQLNLPLEVIFIALE